ncbi:hypothetical protein AAD001_13200 [Colwelliaceae bacterium 6471]
MDTNKQARSLINVMVPQADTFGSIGVIRSLGKNGYNVYATSTKEDALGLCSNYSFKGEVSPQYDAPCYIDWLRNFVIKNDIKAIIPSEDLLLTIEPHFDEFAALLPISHDKKTVYDCFCKVDVFERFIQSNDQQLKKNIPYTAIISELHTPDWGEIATWPKPLYLKGDAFYSKDGRTAFVRRLTTIEAAKCEYNKQKEQYKKILIQGHFTGTKAAVNLFMKEGRLLAESMVYSPHENPYYGGLMSLRHTWWHEKMYQDAVNRVKHLGWVGPAMFEYKYDPKNDTFGFIELNARYWGFFNLEAIAGLDYPVIQLDDFLGIDTPKFTHRLEKNITVRNTFPADFGYMYSKLKSADFNTIEKLACIAEFFYLSCNPVITSDLLYPGDRKLYFINMYRFFKEQLHSCKKKLNF